ncbi:AsmA family protein [Thioalkalivibrio sp. ALMg11]|uniref:AsmA family protein n=1 Tax=Thioalkalivibrio sp. ALMg11 TaxID=1158165 RepID=UPI00037C0FA4|nr:AsmA family protein [Thioalkalivibrio sp. ALMg11]
MKWIKRLLGLIAVLILLVVIVAAYLLITFDANDYKERIEAEVQEATGRELTLSGPIGLTLFPSLGLRLEEVRFGNAEGFGDEPFAEIDVVDVAVAVMPLLRRELEVQRVEADGVRLNLARDEQGRNNWDDLLEHAGEARDDAVGADDEERTETETRLALQRIDVAGISLTNARVRWDDRETGMQATLEPFELQIGRFRPGIETRLDLEAVVRAEGGDLAEPVELALDLGGLLNVDLLNERYSVRRLNATLGLDGGGLPRAVGMTLETDVALEMADAMSLRLERLTLGVSSVRMTGFAELSDLGGEQPQVRTEMRTNTFNLKDVLTDLGMDAPATNDPDALSRIALDFSARGNFQELNMDPFLITVDDAMLSGSAGWDGSGERPLIRFDVSGERLNLDRYLPPELEEARTENGNGERDADEDIAIELPLEALRSVDVDGSAALGRLDVMGMVLRNIELQIRAEAGDWNIQPLNAEAYDGELTSRLRLDARHDAPRYELAADLQGLDIGALLEDFQGDDARLMGTGNLELDITTRGELLSQLKGALNGSGNMRFEDGAVRGINVAQIIRRAEARLRGEQLEDEEPNQTDFSELTGSFNIRDGVVHNEDLEASSPLLRVGGQGQADLNDDTLDYRVNTTIVGTLEGQGGRELDDLRGVTLPIRITGAFTDPSFRLDLEDVVRERYEGEARERVREEQDRARERIDEEEDRVRERIDQESEGLLDRLRNR